jgi:hypothetical protein
VLSLATTIPGLSLLALSWSVPAQAGWGFRGFSAVLALSFSSVGALVASRRPANPIGWLLCAVGVGWGVQVFVTEYATYALLASSVVLPGAEAAAWLDIWLWLPMVTLVAVWLPLLFPDGRFLSARWRPVGWLAAATAPLPCVALAFLPGPIANLPFVQNPLGIEGAQDTLLVGIGLGMVVLAACAGFAAISMALRLRSARGVQRQQLKWFVSAAALLALALPLGIAGIEAFGIKLGEYLLIAAIANIPVATGIAVLRYRLYEIDVLINRTLVYGALTAILGLVYWSLVLLLGTLLRPLTQGSDLAVVGSTLAVAALFQPLRLRIQHAVDRRFYRQRYDASLTLEAFSSRLRHEVDLDNLGAELLAVVGQTMEPERLWLWLRPPVARRGGK